MKTLLFVLAFVTCGNALEELYGQSLAYKALGKREKRDMQEEILHVFGLDHRPRPKDKKKGRSAPQYLMELYRNMDSHSPPNFSVPKDADIIMSFTNRATRTGAHLRHAQETELWFDVSDVTPTEEIISAELRLFRNISKDLHQSSATIDIYLHEAKKSRQEKLHRRHLGKLRLAKEENGWLQFNLTESFMKCIAFSHKNLSLSLRARIYSQDKEINLEELGIVGPKGRADRQPFMVAYLKSSVLTSGRQRRSASTVKNAKRHFDYSVNYKIQGYDRPESKRSCSRSTLYVSFRDLGWQDWIIAPDGYGAFYCEGECAFPLNAHMNATNHAIVQTLVHLMDSHAVPRPCCVPNQLTSITVLYFDDNSNVILKKYKNMVVKSCGCH